MVRSICICGAGTMGSGIALVSAQSGFDTIIFDVKGAVLDKAKQNIQKNLSSLLEKGKIETAEKENIWQRIKFTGNINDCIADVIIEAIIEKTEAKIELFNKLAAINSLSTILASNTSSLSISNIQRKVNNPGRVVGMHFFNPAHLMKLVEVVKGADTDNDVATSVYELCNRMGKKPVMCKDAPGFIVNRVARHYYLEAMKLVEQGVATFEDVDAIMESTGFKMGPFRLMDLIGMDINLSVSKSIYEAFDKAERFKPSLLQVEKVSKGELGRKTAKGFYDY